MENGKNLASGIAAALVLAAVSVHASAGVSPAVPPGNPDDQIRFFWGVRWGLMYDSLVAAGFNMATEPSCGSFYYDMKTGKGKKGPMPGYEELAAKMKRDDFVWMIQLRPFNKYIREKYPRINRDGSKHIKSADSTAPGCMDELRGYVEYHAEVMSKFDCTVGVMTESEERIWSKPSFARHCIDAYKAATGRDMPPEAEKRAAPHWSKLKDIPPDRVVDKDYRLLSFYRWFWADGEGSPRYYRMALDVFREKLGYVPFSMYDPAIRVPPLWGGAGGVTHNDQWKMCYPYPYEHAYIVSEQNAMAEGTPGQRVVTLIQGIAASTALAPTNDLPAEVPEWRRRNPTTKFITPPPDMMLEQLWAVVSRKLDGFGFHGWDALWVESDRTYYHYTNPETRRTVERFIRDVAKPLGPLLKAIPERPPQVAVLDTFASAILSGWRGYDWDRDSRHCGYLAEAANLAPSTLYEEGIEKFGIPESVKVILACGQGVLTREMAAALKAFQKRGGKIVADASLAPAIKADAALPAVAYDAGKDDKDEAEDFGPDGELPKEMRLIRDCKRRDAGWRRRAAELAKICRVWAPVHAEVDSRYVFLRTRTYRSADYVFAVNDKRDFGDYVGQWRRIMEKGVPNRATVTVHRRAGAVYDLVRHKAVPFSVKDGKTLIPVEYETSDGRLLMVVDRPLSRLAVSAETVDGGARVTVKTADADAMIPIKVVSASGKPFYGVVQGGKWTRTVKGASADSVSVVNLADGSSARP